MPNHPATAAVPPALVLLLHLALWQLHGPLLTLLDVVSIANLLDQITRRHTP